MGDEHHSHVHPCVYPRLNFTYTPITGMAWTVVPILSGSYSYFQPPVVINCFMSIYIVSEAEAHIDILSLIAVYPPAEMCETAEVFYANLDSILDHWRSWSTLIWRLGAADTERGCFQLCQSLRLWHQEHH